MTIPLYLEENTKRCRIGVQVYFMVLISFILVVLTFAEPALAWAPATHLYYAKEVLHYGFLLPHAVRTCLTSYTPDFLYGCIAADITLGKKFVEYIYNCHNFDVGMHLLEHARTPPEKAFVYGYLSHLASDTVSHNFFVPYQNIEHFYNVTFRHAYWEVRLDNYFSDRVWGDIETVIRNPRNHGHDRLMDGALKDTIFSFRTNKILFSSMLAIQRLRKWQTFVRTVHLTSRMQFNSQHLAEYNRLAVSAIIRLLSDMKRSPVYLVDPTGAKVLEEVQVVRRMLRSKKRDGRLTPHMIEEECERFRAHVRSLYFEQYPLNAKDFHPSIHMKV